MNSIKNAIVTITLLVVGYGSYLVLQDPPEDVSFQDFAASDAHQPTPAQRPSTSKSQEAEASPDDLDLQIEIGDANAPESSSMTSTLADPPPLLAAASGSGATADAPSTQRQPPSLDFPAVPQSVADTSRFSGHQDAALPMESSVESPVAGLAIPEEDVFEASPQHADPHGTTAFAAGPDPGTGPFATPIVVAVSPTDVGIDSAPGLEAATGSAIPKVDTSSVAAVADVDIPEINDSLGPIPPVESEGSSAFEDAWMTVQQQLRDRDLVLAISNLSPWAADSTLNREQRSRCLHLLDQLAGSVIYSREHHLEPEYVVQSGETLERIAARYNVPQDLLARINGIAPPYALTAGEVLKLVRGPFRAEISLFKSELTLYLGSNYAGRFPVTIGPDLPLEDAFYEVAEKSKGRSYFDRRTGNEVLRGDASNRYGGHWLGLRGEHITTGHSVGIHGRPQQYAGENAGSVSLDPLYAEDVFSILSVGSRVQVTR